MNAIKLPDPVFVADQNHLQEMLESFSTEGALAVDTEANSLYAYQEQVCLIQISTLDRDYILDPLALEDLSPLGEIFYNPDVEKIFHASDYDVQILAEEFGFRFANIFDTMLAARILGYRRLGLDNLLEIHFGVEVNKRYQKANWGVRPLPDEMIRYAQVDTHYLIDLRNILAGKLTEKNRWEVAREDFNRACLAHERPSRKTLPPRWRGNGPQSLSPRKAAVYKALCEYRDDLARRKDLPPFKVFSSKELLALSEACPCSSQEMDRVEGLSRRVTEYHREEILAMVQKGMKAEPFSPPNNEHPGAGYLRRMGALKDWRKHTARKMDVNSSVVMPRSLLSEIATSNPANLDELGEILAEVPWRMEKFGTAILTVLSRIKEHHS